MASVTWLTIGYYWADPPGHAAFLPGSTGVRFYSDALMQTEIFPKHAGIYYYSFLDDVTAVDLNALRTGTLNLSNKWLVYSFATSVNIGSVRILGNPVMSDLSPAPGLWIAVDEDPTGHQVGRISQKYYKVPGGELHIYDLGNTINSIAVNFTVPTYPNMYADPAPQCTGESAVGIPEIPMTYQWYAKQSGNWVALAGFTTLNMPYGTNVTGSWTFPPTAGEQFKLVATQSFPTSVKMHTVAPPITGEKIWTVGYYKLEVAAPGYTTGIVNTPVLMTGLAVGGNNAATKTFTWSFPGSSIPSGTGATISPIWSTPGRKNGTVTVSDGTQTAVRSIMIDISTPPINATITATPTTGDVSQNFVFSVSGVSGGVTPGSYTYAWSGPDGLTGTGTSVSKVFSSAGTKTVTCTITSGGYSNVFTVDVTVTLPAITGSITANPATGNIGDNITYSVSGISGGSGIYTYAWSGSDSLTGTNSSVTKSYTTTGTKTATCVITSGSVSLTLNTSAEIGILPITGSIIADPISVVLGSPINFTMNATGGVGSFVYNWTGDESFTGTTQTVTKTFSTIGTKNVTCAVTSGGVTTNFTTQVTVMAVPTLVVSIAGNVSKQLPNVPVSFISTISGGVGGYTYSWSTTDGFTSTVANPSFTWTTLGAKTVTLTVTSGTQNVSASTTVTIMATITPNLGRLCFVG